MNDKIIKKRVEKLHMIACDSSFDFSYDFKHVITWDHMRILDWEGVRQYKKNILKNLIYPSLMININKNSCI
jgi:hypothetical protein